MNLEQAFLDDIVAHPIDPTPWLVFADWLEERDDPRGELVRLLRLCWDEPRKKVFKQRHARLQELFAAGVPLPLPRFTNSIGMEFVWVPPGAYWRGGRAGEPGKHRVPIDEPFWVGVHPTTQGQWSAVMGNNPSWFARTGRGAEQVREIPDAHLERFPVESVSWNEVQEFIARLNERGAEPGWVYRLPVEEEWEYALRSPVTCRADCAFSFYVGAPSNTLSSARANFNGNFPVKAEKGPFLGRPTCVGSYPPNRLGLFDLPGNVWEWTDTPGESGRVLRGADWGGTGAGCAASHRTSHGPANRIRNLGFRLVRARSVQ
jgi:uncharacterized protein (TIGR02996 family)